MLEFHDYADLFPLLDDAELDELAADIRLNGLHEPVVLYDGQILDGRNRYLACREANVQPDFVQYDGGDPLAFVISMNLHRRHLNSSQRAIIAERDVLPDLEEKAKERQAKNALNNQPQSQNPQTIADSEKAEAREQAAAIMNTNRQYVSDAKKIRKEAPDLIDDIWRGDLSIPKAKRELRKRRNEDKERQALETVQDTDLWHVTQSQSVVECDALITDPPYGILAEDWEPDDLEAFTREWLARWNTCGAGVVIAFWSQEFMWDGRRWFDESLTNYEFEQVLIWHYPNNKGPQSRRKFKQTYEPIFFYRKRGSLRAVNPNGAQWGDGLNDFDCHVAAVPQSNFNKVNYKQHPAQKPLSVMRWLVNATTKIDELVCDPFMGSGTTGIAACQLKRRFHGIELKREYLQLAQRRLATYAA